jgi:hypothetical protein
MLFKKLAILTGGNFQKENIVAIDGGMTLPRNAGGLVVVLVGNQVVVGGGAGNGVLFFGPGAQVDLLAALGTEGTEGIGFDPFDGFTTGRAIDNWHG